MVSAENDLLAWLDTAEEPLSSAVVARQRWQYINHVASGLLVDASLPQVVAAPLDYLLRSRAMIDALSDWIQAHGVSLAN